MRFSSAFTSTSTADYLTDEAAIAEFLNAALEHGNPDVFLQAVRTAARAGQVPARPRTARLESVRLIFFRSATYEIRQIHFVAGRRVFYRLS